MKTPFHDLDDYIGLPRVADLALSPDGTRLVTTVAVLNSQLNAYTTSLWEVDPRGINPARQITQGTESETNPVFTHNGDLLFTTTRSTTADTQGESQVWCLPQAGGEAYPVTDIPGGVEEVHTAANHPTTIIKAAMHPQASDVAEDAVIRQFRKDKKITAIVHTTYPVRLWDKDLGPDFPHLFAVEAGTARLLTPDAGPNLVGTNMDVSPCGKWIVATMRQPTHRGDHQNVVVRIDAHEATWKVIFAQDDAAHPIISPDGSMIAFLGETIPDPYTAPQATVWVMNADGTNARMLTPNWRPWPTSLTWLADGSGLLVTADYDGRGPIFNISLDGQIQQITRTNSTFSNVVSGPGNQVYALHSSYEFPPEVVTIDVVTGDVHTLLGPSSRPDIPGELREVETQASDGTRIRSWLVLPQSHHFPAPLLLWIHGGPLNSWNAWSWRWNPWIAAAYGYAVLLPDPGLSTGYGQEFIQRGWGSWGGAPYTDLMAAVDGVAKLPEIDAERSAAMGGSFGGYMANWVATQTDRFRAIVTHASLWNLHTFGATTDTAFYWAKEMTEDMVAANTPHTRVESITTPMLVIHGDKDYRVPIGEALALWYDLLARSGLPAGEDGTSAHQFLYFPDENHWVLSPQHAKIWYETVLDFLATHVRGGN